MRILKSVSIAAMAFALSSCSSLTADQQALVDQVQQGAVKVCGFIPDVKTVLGLLGVTIPGGPGVDAAINIVCNAVTPTPAGVAAAPRRFGQTMTATAANGKPVTGMFVR